MNPPVSSQRAITPAALLTARLRDDASSPLITYYDDATGERVELSAATFANWVAKTANLLRDDLGVGDPPTAGVELPGHWQALAVVHAVWALGGCVRIGPSSVDAPADVAFVTRAAAETVQGADEVVVLALRPMAMPGEVPPAAWIDYDRDVRTHGDVFSAGPVSPDAAAVVGPGGVTTHGQIVARAAERVGRAREATGSVRFAWDASSFDLERDVDVVLQALVSGGGLVLSTGETPVARLMAERAAAWPAGGSDDPGVTTSG